MPTPRMKRSGEDAVRGGLTGVAFDPLCVLCRLIIRDARLCSRCKGERSSELLMGTVS